MLEDEDVAQQQPYTGLCNTLLRTAGGRVLEDENVAQAVTRALLGRERLGRHAGRRRQQLLLVYEGHLPR